MFLLYLIKHVHIYRAGKEKGERTAGISQEEAIEEKGFERKLQDFFHESEM